MVSSFNVLDFHDIANFLIDRNPEKEEASIRTAIGRIYYAVFLTIRDKAKSGRFREIDYPGVLGIHDKLIAFLQMEAGKTVFIIARHLKQLKTLRLKSDYEKDEITKKDFELAKALFENLRIKIQDDSDWNF